MSQGDVLERFHRALVEEIRNRHPDYLHAPFTVAEIYQNLVPYGTHRDRLGVEMNGDYEDALLRMLAGEGGYLLLESEHALRDLREELRSTNPNTGLYREFAALDVRLNPERVLSPPFAPPEADEDAVSMADLAPDPAPAASTSVQDTASSRGEVPPSCRWCRADLPDKPNLNFCPFCGTDVHVVPCPACGEELEPEWRFCIACGAEVSG
jgi:Double zinc ribbon